MAQNIQTDIIDLILYFICIVWVIIVYFRRGSIENLQKRVDRPNVKIECENGSVFYADHVICTAPLGRTMYLIRFGQIPNNLSKYPKFNLLYLAKKIFKRKLNFHQAVFELGPKMSNL